MILNELRFDTCFWQRACNWSKTLLIPETASCAVVIFHGSGIPICSQSPLLCMGPYSTNGSIRDAQMFEQTDERLFHLTDIGLWIGSR